MALYTTAAQVEDVVRRGSLDTWTAILNELADGGSVGFGGPYVSPAAPYRFPLNWEAISAEDFQTIYLSRSSDLFSEALIALRDGALLQVV